MLDAASARKRASASSSSLAWHARIKARSASASASRVRLGPHSKLPLNGSRARKRLEVGARVPSPLDDGFAGAMPKSKQPCEYTTQAVRLEERPPRRSNVQSPEPEWLRCGKTHKALHHWTHTEAVAIRRESPKLPRWELSRRHAPIQTELQIYYTSTGHEERPPRESNAQTLEPGWLRCGETHKALH